MIKGYWSVLKFGLTCFFLSACALPSLAQSPAIKTSKPVLEHIAKLPPDTNRLKLQLQLGIYFLFKPGNLRPDKDSAMVQFSQAMLLANKLRLIKWKNETLLLIAYRYLQTDSVTKATPIYFQVIAYYHTLNDKKAEAETWERFGDSYNRAPELLEKKVESYRHARELFKQANLQESAILAHKKMGDMLMVEGKYKVAESELLQVVKEFKAINYKKLHYTYDLLASLYKLKGNLHQELFYKLKVVQSMEATSDFELATYFYYNLATAYYDLGLYDNCLKYDYKALPFSVKERNYTRYYELLRDIVKVLITEEKTAQALKFLQAKTLEIPPGDIRQEVWMDAAFGSCYHKLGLDKKAEGYYLNMIKLAGRLDRFQYEEDYLNIYSLVSNFYVETGQYKKAHQYLSNLSGAAPTLMRPASMGQIELMQFKVDSAGGNWRTAMKHYETYKRINDSLFNATKKKLLEEVQIRYESEQKDRDLRLQFQNIQLLKKQNLLDQNQVDRAQAIKNVLIAGTILLAILLAVIYNRYRLKQRNNLLLEQNQKVITAKNITLEKLLRDNEWLLKELHHRVKNNMQSVTNLLNSQSRYLKDEAAQNAVRDSRRRIQAMSLIHQKLYNSDNVSIIYMPEYIGELVDYLKDSFEITREIYFDLDIAPVSLDVIQAVPVGLILNEAITNAIKYAFPFANDDRVRVSLNTVNFDEVLLVISDNGKGLPADFDIDKPDAFGLKLVRGLTEEIGGIFTISSDNGTTVSIDFQVHIAHNEDA